MGVEAYSFGPFQFDGRRKMLAQSGKTLPVGHKGLVLLQTLIEACGEPVSKSDLLEAAWPGTAVEESNLTVQIASLRRILGPTPEGSEWIVTVPRFGYRFAYALDPREPDNATNNGHDADATETLDTMPSIAVLPFVNLSGDQEHDYLVDGITEDIITALTRCRWFFVISRSSSFLYKGRSIDTRQIAGELCVRYLLEGSVRKSGNAIRVSVQLVDATVGRDIWAKRYDLQADDFFAIQDEIALRVVGAIEPELLKTESALAISRTGSNTALDLVRRGTWYFHKVTRENHYAARELFRQAHAIDPELVEANLWLGRVAAGIVAYGWAEDSEAEIAEGVAAAQKAVQADGLNPYTHYALAIASLVANYPANAISAAQAAIETNPSFALGYLALGFGQFSADQAENAIESLQRGLALNAHDPQNFVWYDLLCLACLFADRPEQALQAAQKGAAVRPAWRPIVEKLAISLAATGQTDEARRTAERAQQLEGSDDSVIAPLRRFHPERAALIDAMLRQLGS